MGKSGSKSQTTAEYLEELEQNTEFTFTELKAWHKDFKKNFPNGKMTKDQFQVVYANLFPKANVSEFSEHVFRNFDSNCDGMIDFREFACSLSVIAKGKLEEKLKWMFNMYDMDSNGYITKDEMLTIVRSIHKIKDRTGDHTAEERTEFIFNELDTTPDGKISEGEFLTGVASDPAMCAALGL